MAAGSLSFYKLFIPDTRSLQGKNGVWLFLLWFLSVICVCSSQSLEGQLTGYRTRIAYSNGITDDGVFAIPADQVVTLLLFGEGLSNRTYVKFTDSSATCSDHVDRIGGNEVELYPPGSDLTDSFTYSVDVSFTVTTERVFYFCIDYGDGRDYQHQGSDPWLRIVVQPETLPLWAKIIFIIVLMTLSGLFSGLNLGLMALDPTTLKIIKKSGSKWQRTYANIIFRVRKHGNYLLCTLLLGNVIVNSTLTILLDDVLPSGVYAVIASTLAIVIFGEIIPQAICSRHGLVIGAWTIPLTLVFMVATFPLSLPLSLILNCILGKEIGAVYNRDQLLKLLDVTQEHHDLVEDEVNIISGVLAFKDKAVEEVMTKFEDVYCISVDSVLDFKLMREIYDSGFSRIPIYENDRNTIVGLLYVRDLAFVDPDDQTSVQAHMEFYKHEVPFVWPNEKLGDVLSKFTSGKSHMAIVQTFNNETDGDPFYESIGVVTLEDIIEEILQREIVDETDRFVDNRSKKLHSRKNFNVAEFDSPSEEHTLSSQQRLAVFQFLSTAVEPFQKQYVSNNVLKRLLTKNVVRKISLEESNKTNFQLYTVGKEASFFTLVLEGCMQVQIGKDGLKFDSRAFTFFGAQALMEPPDSVYTPDYTVRPSADSTVIIITKRQYSAAREASRFEEERGGVSPESTAIEQPKSDVFAKEWELAEDKDIQDSQSAGLSSITKLLSKRQKYSRQYSDKRHLLSDSSRDSNESQDLSMKTSMVTLVPEEGRGWLALSTDTLRSQSNGRGVNEMMLDRIQDFESEPTIRSQHRTSSGGQEWTSNASTAV